MDFSHKTPVYPLLSRFIDSAMYGVIPQGSLKQAEGNQLTLTPAGSFYFAHIFRRSKSIQEC